MTVQTIMDIAGGRPATTRPDAPIVEVADMLVEAGTGALVAEDADGSVAGIISERDLVRGLREHGEGLLSMRAEALMTRAVVTCSVEHEVEDVMRLMTENAIRHIPVVDADGGLVGMVSILDVVRSRLAAVETDYGTLRNFMDTRIE